MPKPISWQCRLRDIERQVRDSSRNPYAREAIERLFRISTPTAKKLVELIPRTVQGNSFVIEREDLLEFLSLCLDAEDLSAHLDAIRKAPPRAKKSMLRVFVPRDYEDGNLQSIFPFCRLKRNSMEIFFGTQPDGLSKLAQVFMAMATPEFDRRYCTPPAPTSQQVAAAQESKRFRAENRYLVKAHAARTAAQEGKPDLAQTLCNEAAELLQEIERMRLEAGQEMDEFIGRANAMLSALFPPQPVASADQTASPASIAPPAVDPLPLPGLEDRSASSPHPCDPATSPL